ncbi:amidohydrolase family protein [Ramlibacter tataouinensis]|uniref:amidohydrolase family protein n=1 Tax=Ramlibacter tataouinensis TaxID=94132 RepID=UPI0022F40681|nr:amidohydrolase family protein [Ramlibacter tataouinensis]WBY02908.1 amidohydrolase family protein [Ramlibacter tataouinensis]
MRHDSDGRRLPIKLDSTSNGEVAPVPLEPVHLHANALAHQAADANAKRLGLSRRRLLVSAAGAAGTLLAFNEAYAAAGRTGGFYEIEQTAAIDVEEASQRLGSREFIFDVQGHFVGRNWQGRHGLGGVDQFVKDVFLDSDTDMMVLSFIPSRRENEYLPIAEAAGVQEIVSRLPRSQRLLIHGRVNPNQPGDMEDIDALASRWKVSALKCYTQWGPDGRGFYLTDDIGIRMIEKARSVGIRNICVHKGLPFGRQSYEHSTCADIGSIARMFPDVNFLVYHAGYVQSAKEGPYDPTRSDGVDRLIRSVEEAGLGKGSNVYGELGSTWRMLMRDPDQAAHVVGKLVKHLGEGNVLWGSDSIWYGSPQDQIQAFRTFQISSEYQDKFGYAAMTPLLRARIFGLNGAQVYGLDVEEVTRRAAADEIGRARAAYDPDPHFLTFGPKTRAQFLRLRAAHGNQPG